MVKLFILCGLPGSGKSTYAKNFLSKKAVILSSDEIRKELLNDESRQDNNALVFETLYNRAKKFLSDGKNVVIDATNINKFERHRVLENFKHLKIEKICIFINTPLKICYEQDKNRNRVVGEDVINHFQSIFEPPTLDEGFDEIIVIE